MYRPRLATWSIMMTQIDHSSNCLRITNCSGGVRSSSYLRRDISKREDEERLAAVV